MAKIIFSPDEVAKSADINANFAGTWDGSLMDDESIDVRHLTVSARGVTGSVVAFAGITSNIPEGWLLCDGSSLVRSVYSDLYAAIGTQFGSADSTHFNIPNLLGRVIAGVSASDSNFGTLGQIGGEDVHQLSWNEMPSHSHGVGDPGHSHGVGNAIGWGAGPGNAGRARVDSNSPANPWGASNVSGTGIWIGGAGADWAHNNLQPYMALNYIIKT